MVVSMTVMVASALAGTSILPRLLRTVIGIVLRSRLLALLLTLLLALAVAMMPIAVPITASACPLL